MATRNELEQEALRQVQRGDYSKAARIYHAILRQQPRDRRARQKLGEIYLKMGQKKEGAKYLREVAGLAMKEGQHRAAIAIYGQLAEILGEDVEIIGALADCYRESNQLHEAARIYEQALNLARATRTWEHAVGFATALVELRPGDLAAQYRLGELRESAGDPDGALKDYRRMAATFQRRGEMAEVARVAETALRLAPGDADLVALIVRARVALGEHERALEVGRPFLANLGAHAPALAEALGTALLKVGQEQRARGVFLDVADRFGDAGENEGQARCLRLALEAGAEDPSLRAAIQLAEARGEKLKRRLSSEPVLSPASDDDLVACTRAEVQSTYGFPQRALETLRTALEQRPGSVALGARMAETHWDLGQRGEALRLLESVTRAASGQAREVLASRLIILGGPDLMSPPAPAAAESAPAVASDDDEQLLDETTDERPPWDREQPSRGVAPGGTATDDEELIDDEDRGALPELEPDGVEDEDFAAHPAEEAERLVAAGDLDGAIARLQEAYRADPADQELLMRIAELRRQQRASREPSILPPADEDPVPGEAEDPVHEPDEVAPRSLAARPAIDGEFRTPIAGLGQRSEAIKPGVKEPGRWHRLLGGAGGNEAEDPWPSREEGPTPVTDRGRETSSAGQEAQEIWSQVAIGRYEQALPATSALDGLLGRWLEARCLQALGRHERATQILGDALEEAPQDDAIYPEALLLLATLQVAAGRNRAATRTARDLADNFPEWRSGEVAALIRGLSAIK